jgi:hypothetical protein
MIHRHLKNRERDLCYHWSTIYQDAPEAAKSPLSTPEAHTRSSAMVLVWKLIRLVFELRLLKLILKIFEC